MNREKNEKTKELIAQEELILQLNEDVSNKLREEVEKYNGLLDEQLDVDEKLKRSKVEKEYLDTKLKDQGEEIEKDDKEIADKTKVVDDLLKQVEEVKE